METIKKSSRRINLLYYLLFFFLFLALISFGAYWYVEIEPERQLREDLVRIQDTSEVEYKNLTDKQIVSKNESNLRLRHSEPQVESGNGRLAPAQPQHTEGFH